jgi:hypothetical protein
MTFKTKIFRLVYFYFFQILLDEGKNANAHFSCLLLGVHAEVVVGVVVGVVN